MQSEKFYILVRRDLSPGSQIAQSVHAKDLFSHAFPEIEKNWFNNSNTIVILGVENEDELFRMAGKIEKGRLKSCMFFESDINEYTAIAVEPSDSAEEILADLSTAG